jgi:hypothetical protein
LWQGQRGEINPNLTHALALNPLRNLNLHLTPSLVCNLVANPSFEFGELRALLETDVNDDGKHQSTIEEFK